MVVAADQSGGKTGGASFLLCDLFCAFSLGRKFVGRDYTPPLTHMHTHTQTCLLHPSVRLMAGPKLGTFQNDYVCLISDACVFFLFFFFNISSATKESLFTKNGVQQKIVPCFVAVCSGNLCDLCVVSRKDFLHRSYAGAYKLRNVAPE